ncbi:hypothetical protein [Pseudomonas turukhanskensis]|uniref:hypothetical protein n=1 Tax=Pseudomonas turukhanskensis TaxID=1806536 RepID=UPI0022F2F4EC|nr:hypothetical protein [Pseudomonas turukhanskensis]
MKASGPFLFPSKSHEALLFSVLVPGPIGSAEPSRSEMLFGFNLSSVLNAFYRKFLHKNFPEVRKFALRRKYLWRQFLFGVQKK